MSAVLSTPKTTSGGEIITHLTNASDAAGLHFADGGYVDLANSAGAEFGLGDFSIEFILNQTEENAADNYIYFTHIDSPSRFYLFNDISSNWTSLGWQNSAGATQLRNISYDMSADYNTPTHYALTCDRNGLATLYKNGNSVGSVDISAESAINIGALNSTVSRFGSTSTYGVIGTFYRFRTWNKSLSQAEVTASYENATVPFADQYGSQTSKLLNGTAWTGATGATVPNSWTLGGAGTFTIDSGGGSGAEPALRIDRNGTDNNPYLYQNFTAVIGVKYRVSYQVKNGTATSIRVGIGSTSVSTDYDITSYTSTSWASFNETFTATTALFSIYVQAITSTGTESTYIDSVKVEQIGCVADYDLAFANPARSFKIQDRAGAADGTASNDGTNPTGIEQVTPIEQLNSKSARIGTSAATPADGDLLVSGNVGVGTSSPEAALDVNSTVAGGVGTVYGAIIRGTEAAGADMLAGDGIGLKFEIPYNLETSQVGASIEAVKSSSSDSNSSTNLLFKTSANNETLATALTIDSTGLVTVGDTAATASTLRIGQGSAGNHTSKLELVEALTDGAMVNGFSFTMDGAATNNLVIRRHSASSSGAVALDISRNTGLATFSAGIAFESSTSGTGSSASSYTLDHYEEGTWTPALSAPSSGTLTYTSTGLYTRIGDLVHIAVTIDVTVVTSLPAESFRITNVPFNSKEVMAGKYYLNNFGISQATCVKTAERTEDMHIGSYAASDDNYIYINQHGSLINLDDLQVGLLQYAGTFKTSDA